MFPLSPESESGLTRRTRPIPLEVGRMHDRMQGIASLEFFGEWILEHYELETAIHKARLCRLKEAGTNIRTVKQRLEGLQDRSSGGW